MVKEFKLIRRAQTKKEIKSVALYWKKKGYHYRIKKYGGKYQLFVNL